MTAPDEAAIRRAAEVVAGWPPLSDAQRDRLADLLQPSADDCQDAA